MHGVVFSDESRFNLYHNDGRVQVYRRNGERYTNNGIVERDRFGCGGVLVWGAIFYNFRSRLLVIYGNLTARGYIDEILRPELVPLVRRKRIPMLSQQDNARPHMARLTQDIASTFFLGRRDHRIFIRSNTYGMSWAVAFVDVNTRRRLCGSWRQRFSKSRPTSLDVLSDACVVQCDPDCVNSRNVQVNTLDIDVARDLVDPLCVCDDVDRKPDVIGLIGLRDQK